MKIADLENCRIIKIILMLLIVLYHSVYYSGVWMNGSLLAEGFIRSFYSFSLNWFNSFQNYAFFFISGYLYAYVRYERKGYPSFKDFVIKKVKRLLVPFAFATLFWSIPIRYFFLKHSVRQIIKNAILAVNPDQYWFLLALFFVFIIFWFLSDFARKRPILCAFVLLLAYYLGEYCQTRFCNYFCIFSGISALPWFGIGFLLRTGKNDAINRVPLVVWPALHMLCLCFWSYAQNSVMNYVAQTSIRFITGFFGMMAAFVLLNKLAEGIDWKDSRMASVLGRCMLPVYLFHYQIVYIVVDVLNGRTPFLTTVLISFFASFVISYILSRVLLKNKVTAFLMGS